MELPREIYKKITSLSAQGDELTENANYAAALRKYWDAFDLLPEPKDQWEAATWLLASIGDANFFGGDYEAGRDNLSFAMRCPDAIGNAFLHLRPGQCHFELGDLDRAAEELTRAFMAEGKQIFENDDPKYLVFVKSKLDPPAGGWPAGT